MTTILSYIIDVIAMAVLIGAFVLFFIKKMKWFAFISFGLTVLGALLDAILVWVQSSAVSGSTDACKATLVKLWSNTGSCSNSYFVTGPVLFAFAAAFGVDAHGA